MLKPVFSANWLVFTLRATSKGQPCSLTVADCMLMHLHCLQDQGVISDPCVSKTCKLASTARGKGCLEMMPAQARNVSHLVWQCLMWCLQTSSMSTLAGMLHATQDLELISPLHCTDGQHQNHESAVKSQSLQHSARLRAHMTSPDPTLLRANSVAMGSKSLQCHHSVARDTHPPPNCIMQVLSSRGSWPSCQESQQHPSQLAASLSADMLTAALGCCADAEQQRQLVQLLGELRRLEVQQDTLKKAVMENRPIVVHPRMKPQEEEEEEEEAKPSGPAKPKYIASGG